MTRLALFSVVMLAPAALRAQVTAAPTTSATSVKSTITAPLAMTPEQRHAFETSITSTPSTTPAMDAFPTVQLAWQAIPGATYRVLRYSTLTSPPAQLTPTEAGARYVARILPGYPFYFRVVALDSKGSPMDTTTAVYATTPVLVANSSVGANTGSFVGNFHPACAVNPPSTLTLTWTPRSDIAEYGVALQAASSSAVIANITVTGGTFSQAGLPADRIGVEFRGYYVMPDYPTPGQVSKATAAFARMNAVAPVTTSTGCTGIR